MTSHHRRTERTPRLLPALLTLAALSSWWPVPVSQAAEPPRVVMVTAGELPATGERVRAELAAMGFAIVLDEGSAALTRDALGEVAQARDAVAAVALTFSPAGITLWVVERANRETRLHSFVSAEQAGAGPTLALRAAEQLRASLLHVAAEPALATEAAVLAPAEAARDATREPSAAPVVASASRVLVAADSSELRSSPELSFPADSSRALSLRLGGGLVTSAGGLGTFPSVDLAAKWWLTQRFGVELAALVPLARLSERSEEGSSATRVAALSLVIAAAVPIGSSAWVWDIGAGVAGVGLQTRGTPAHAAYTRKESVGVAVAPLLRSALSHSLLRSVRLSLAASAGVSIPRFLIVYAGRAAATWGRPFVAGELALEVDVF